MGTLNTSTSNQTNGVERLTYSIEETAQMLGVSRLTVVRLAYKGQLASKKIGRRRLIPKAAIEKLLKDATA